MNRRHFMTCAGLSIIGFGRPGRADPPLLRIGGALESGQEQFLTDADLMALPQISFETSTLWTTGTNRYSGPSLAAVLDSVGAAPGNLQLTALNAYSVDMDRGLVGETVPIIANRINGRPFGPREKGPLWLMFPFDLSEEVRRENIYALSIWQLNQISIRGA